METSLGDIVIDLDVVKSPRACENFVKLCKLKAYNFSLFHSVQRNFMVEAGRPALPSLLLATQGLPTSLVDDFRNGSSVWGLKRGSDHRFFTPNLHPTLKHNRIGTVSMAASLLPDGSLVCGSQFFITTTSDNLEYLDGKHAVFGVVAEGLDILKKFNHILTDEAGRPFRDIRIKHTEILDYPFLDPVGLIIPSRSPSPTPEILADSRIGEDEDLFPDIDPVELERLNAKKEADARTYVDS